MAPLNYIIQRKRLIKLAEKFSNCKILYVQAPAGYGKTIFAGQWLESRKGMSIQVVFDEYDNTVEDLCLKLKKILEELNTNEDRHELSYINHPDFDKAPMEFLTRAAVAAPKDMRACVVIDDLHYITDDGVQKALLNFLMRLPEGIKICILSRTAPPESFCGLILKNGLKFISQDQLLFDSREIYALYKNRGIAITRKQAETVLEFTEGWPIGINALLFIEKNIPTENIPHIWLENFLKTQVWEMWDECTREFMVGTCMEDELSESLCNALTGTGNSSEILKHLQMEGAFLTMMNNGNYRFHKLFRDFLRKQFSEKPIEYREKQIGKAGQWYLEHNDFYRAVARFSYIKDYEQVACCFDLLEDMDRAGFDTEQVMRAVHNALDEDIVKLFPYLYYMLAYTARNEGRINDFKHYADQYYLNYPKIVKRNPELAHNIFFLYTMDTRFTLKEIIKLAGNTQISGLFRGVRGSATLYFPFYHRSYRDFSEILPGDVDAEVEVLENILGPLLGNESTMLTGSIRAGLYYEKGLLQHAQEKALVAVSKLQCGFTPESKFCVMVLLMQINHAMRQYQQEKTVQTEIQKMIEDDGAFYLQYNFDAVTCRNQLTLGDTTAAEKWLETKGSSVYGLLDFIKLYGHFTTARAHIVLGDYNQAVILLEKILEMAKALNRTVDVIEAMLFLAIVFWKKKRSNQNKAMHYLEEAVRIAQPLEYEQAFINEGTELKNMLSRLKNRTIRSDYAGDLSGPFVRRLYIGAVGQAQFNRGITGDRIEPEIQFTQQQKRVMKLMCDGYSYRKIAEELGIAFSTVRSHIELIYRKMDVSDMKEAVLKIHQLHILED